MEQSASPQGGGSGPSGPPPGAPPGVASGRNRPLAPSGAAGGAAAGTSVREAGSGHGGAAALLVVSWNVAGYATAAKEVAGSVPGGVPELFKRWGADVVCVQETKAKREHLQSPSAKGGVPREIVDMEAYDSFWACNEGAQGMNGVATFARKGATRAADPAPLRDPELDAQGRVLVTDHGKFSLVNVYAPSGVSGLEEKLRFLHALRGMMQRLRADGRPVILAGDLNVAYRPDDQSTSHLLAPVAALLRHLCDGEPLPSGTWLSSSIAGRLGGFVAHRAQRMLRSGFVTAHKGKESGNHSFGARAKDWWQANVYVQHDDLDPDSTTTAQLGPKCDSEAKALEIFQMRGASQGNLVVRAPGFMDCDTAAQLFSLAGARDFSENEKRDMGVQSCSAPGKRAWIQALLREDKMIDTFAHVHRLAVNRFTCWNQYTNRRYYNDGSRIDYILVDARLGNVVLQGGELAKGLKKDPNTAMAAKAAACGEAMGSADKPVCYSQAAYDGSGLPEAPRACIESSFRPPHTGIIYTPPRWSDHVAVSLLLRMKLPELELKHSPAAQPHRDTHSVKALFAKAATKPVAAKTTEDLGPPRTLSVKATVKATAAPAKPAVGSGQGRGKGKRPALEQQGTLFRMGFTKESAKRQK